MENNNELNQQETPAPDQTIFTEEQFSMDGYDKHIRQARNAIFAAAAILLINVIVMVATAPSGYEYIWIDVAFWSAFIVGFVILAFWTKKKPYTAIICALILYTLFIVINAILNPMTLLSGIIFKIIIYVCLFKGINDAKDAQQMQKQMDMK